MKQMVHILLTLSLVCTTICSVLGQSIPASEEEARAELAKRGISEEEVIEAMARDGILLTDINNIQDLSPQELQSLQTIIRELETQQKAVENTEIRSTSKPNSMPDMSAVIDSLPIDSVMLSNLPEEREVKQRIYGQDIFTNGSIEVFQNSSDIKLPDNYILGVGDELSVSIFGRSQFEEKYEIRSDGYIRILDGNRRLLLKGSTLASAKDKLFKAFSNYYSFNK